MGAEIAAVGAAAAPEGGETVSQYGDSRLIDTGVGALLAFQAHAEPAPAR